MDAKFQGSGGGSGGLIFDALNAGRYILGGDYDPFGATALED